MDDYRLSDVPKHIPVEFGSISQKECFSGSFQNQTGQTSCIDAYPGHYVDSSASASQTPCSAGTYNPQSGSARLRRAWTRTRGTTSTRPRPPARLPAPRGRGRTGPVNPRAWTRIRILRGLARVRKPDSLLCWDLQPAVRIQLVYGVPGRGPGYYVDSSASASRTPCSAGTTARSRIRSSTACLDADPGYYVDYERIRQPGSLLRGDVAEPVRSTLVHGRGSRILRGLARVRKPDSLLCWDLQPAVRIRSSTACMDADPGYYVDSSASASQTPCSAGTYNPQSGSNSSTACLDADPGYYVDTNASASQAPCSAGTWQNQSVNLVHGR